MKHIDEKTLELYVLDSEGMENRREEIVGHIKECAACSLLYDEIRQYYAEVTEVQEERARAASQALTVQAVALEAEQVYGTGLQGERKLTLPARFFLFVVRRPIVASAGFVACFGAAILGFMNMFGPSPNVAPITDTNPLFARAKEEFLVVLNSQGQELWRKHVGQGFDADYLEARALDFHKYLVVTDVDGDRKNEVVAAFGGMNTWDSSKSVICYNADKSTKWSYKLSRKMTFGNETIEDAFFPRYLLVDDFDSNGSTEVIAVAANTPLYPNVIIKLDGKTGALLSEYWNSGVLGPPRVVDIDNNGVKEILITGANNGFHYAPLIILDPRHISGHSPAPPSHTPVGVSKGGEKYYILLPKSDLSAFSTTGNTEGNGLSVESDLIRLSTIETLGKERPSLVYYFDPNLKCNRVEDSNEFTVLHNKYRSEGKLSKPLNDAYWKELLRGVLYWDGDKFVNTPTMNKRYVEVAKSFKPLP
ncbi:MAG: hypothetical protein ACKVRP_01030 [Bacteroidota bacterium]